MKKRFLALLLAGTMSLSLVACGGGSKETTTETTTTETTTEATTEDTASEETTTTETTTEAATEAPEQSVVTWNYGSSGNVLVTIANEKGYFAEEGITIEPVAATANADAMSLLASGKVNVVSNAGTSNPLQQIAQGVDITVFGGHMIEGCMPVVALPDTEWNGIESFLGEKVAVNPSYFAFTGAVMEAGAEDPMTAVEWTVFSSYDDALIAVQKGEVKYALMGTGQNLAVQQLAAQGDIKIVSYQSEIMENYSCCRMVAQTSWVNENPNTVKAICRALLRAQAYYEANKEEAVTLHAAAIEATDEYVAAYMLDDVHYFVSVDPLKDGVVRAWGILDATGYLGEDCQIDILDHINTDLYAEALAEATELYGAENPDFYAAQLAFFNEHNK